MKWPGSWGNIHLGTALRRGESWLDALRAHRPRRHRDADATAAGAVGSPPAGTAAGTPPLSVVLDALIASGVSIQAMTEFAALWPSLDETVRGQISRPLGGPAPGPLFFGAAHAEQIDGSTCGPAALVMPV